MYKTLMIGILGLLLLGATPTLSAQPPVEAAATQPATKAAGFDEWVKAKGGAATTQTSGELDKLRAELAALRAENAQLKTEITKLKTALASAAPGPGAADDKTIVLSPAEFGRLPKGTRTKTPLGFTDVAMNKVGWIHTAKIIYIIDDSTAIVSTILDSKDGSPLIQPYVAKEFVIEGLSTKGQADDSGWTLTRWFRIVGTGKFNGSTYFIAHQIVQADKTPAAK